MGTTGTPGATGHWTLGNDNYNVDDDDGDDDDDGNDDHNDDNDSSSGTAPLMEMARVLGKKAGDILSN